MKRTVKRTVKRTTKRRNLQRFVLAGKKILTLLKWAALVSPKTKNHCKLQRFALCFTVCFTVFRNVSQCVTMFRTVSWALEKGLHLG